MFVVIIKNKVKEGFKKEYLEASKLMAKDTSMIDGCISALALDSKSEDHVIVNYECWENEAAFKAYDGSAFFKYKSMLKPYFEGNTTELYEA